MCFVFPKLRFLWVLNLYCHTLSYTFHTEVELVYKDLNKSIVKYNVYSMGVDRLCGLVVRVSGYRYRGLGFDSRRYQIF